MSASLNILVIDDNPADIRQLEFLLKNSDLKQITLTHTQLLSTSLDVLDKDVFDIILLELALPDSEGIETFRTIHKIAINTPIIILTRLQNEPRAVIAISEGAQDYFIKGAFDGPRLARAMTFAIERQNYQKNLYQSLEIIENANEAIFSLTVEGVINGWNLAAENLFHYRADEIIGQRLHILTSTANHPLVASLLNTAQSGQTISAFEINFLDKQGKPIESLINVAPIKTNNGIITGFTIFAQDLTKQKEAEQIAAIQLRIQAALTETKNIDAAPHRILKTICEILDYQTGEIWAIDPKKNTLQCVSNWRAYNTPSTRQAPNNNLVFYYNEGIPGAIWASKQPYWTCNLKQAPLKATAKLSFNRENNCCLGFPILSNEDVLGVILFFGDKINQPDIRLTIMFEFIGKQIGAFFKQNDMAVELFHLIRHDKLTGLSNRMATEETLNEVIEQAKTQRTMVALLCLDLDNFKTINESLGYKNGNLLLQEIAKRLKRIAPEKSLIARFNGDEFAIVLPNVKSKKTVDSFAKKVSEYIELPFKIENQSTYLSVSIGISLYPQDGQDSNTLFSAANFAMYLSKGEMGNRFQYPSLELEKLEQKNIKLESQLHQALEKNEFFLYYQPIVNVKTNEIEGVEALLRWKKAEGEIASPTEFIPLLEQSGLILSVGDWVLETACTQFKTWEHLGIQSVAVNISSHQLNLRLVKNIKNLLKKTRLKPNQLIIEITESVLMTQQKKPFKIINALNKLGVRVSIDDFGTGYSSFAYLRDFKVAILKIDQSFITNVHENINSRLIIEAIIAMAHTLNIKTIAEGVETKEALDFLKEKGCDEYQGYYCSKPLPPDELIKLLETPE